MQKILTTLEVDADFLVAVEAAALAALVAAPGDAAIDQRQVVADQLHQAIDAGEIERDDRAALGDLDLPPGRPADGP